MSTILLVGADQSLLRTRAAVLRRTECQTVLANPSSALLLQAQHSCDVVVLCHTLADHVGLALLRTIRERWPHTRILQILPQRDWGTRSAAALADAVCFPEPERLIKHTKELLHRWELFRRTDQQFTGSSSYLN